MTKKISFVDKNWLITDLSQGCTMSMGNSNEVSVYTGRASVGSTLKVTVTVTSKEPPIWAGSSPYRVTRHSVSIRGYVATVVPEMNAVPSL